MGIRMVRQPSAVYTAKKDSNYYAEDDVNLTTSLGVLSADTNAYLVNLVYGKVILNNIEYLVSIEDMEMESDMKNYNSVSNIDDIIPFRYAYGNQDGYVIGKGTEISHTIDGSTFRINSGRVVLQGVETDIDANGVSFTIDNSSETRYFVVYYEVNLATQTTAIRLSDYSTNDYPSIDTGDDLTVSASGIARTELYRFTAISGVISDVEKTAKAIEYSGTALVGYDISKGTVENRFENFDERLTSLGFKEGSVSLNTSQFRINDIYSFDYRGGNKITKQGNYVILSLCVESIDYLGLGSYTIGTLPNDFKPISRKSLGSIEQSLSASVSASINTSGQIVITKTSLGTEDNVKLKCFINAGYSLVE